MQDILDGKLIPRKYLQGCQVTNPSLEDYALTREESAVAKEPEEVPAVLSYIEQHNLQNFSFNKPAEPQPSVEPTQSIPNAPTPPEAHKAPKKSGKRAQSQAEIWEPVRNAAKALWADNNQLRIAEVIKRIKRMPVFKASAMGESAIRKHIADLAPPDIRGKPGRKPGRSS